MKFWALAPLLLLSTETIASRLRARRDYDAYDYYAVHIRSGADPELLSRELGLELEGPLGELDDHYVLRTAEKRHEYDHIQTSIEDLKRRRRKREAGAEQPHVLDHVLLARKQELHKRFPLVKRSVPVEPLGQLESRQNLGQNLGVGEADVYSEAEEIGIEIAKNLSITDPIFHDQWHLYNSRELGHDINVTGVWQSGITGKGSTVCIVDDGLDMDSEDLKENYFAKGSWDYNDPGPDPKPRLSDDHHGTRCAGEISAVRNDVCGVGVAYDGKVSGVRILSKVISDVDEAEALNYGYQDNHIYSCSWGPPDNGAAMEGPSVLIKRAMLKGVQQGRGGLGSVFVFAIGNGAANDDNCNFDGYTNSIYSVSVGGIDRKGKHPYYSEKCSAQLVVTYSSGSGDAIHTTDVGANACYVNHGGTSAAGPLVAGIFALMLEANANLNWRDFQWLTVITAVKLDQDAEYQRNEAMEKDFSHAFGYGKADAWALVEAAKTWKSVKPQAWYFSPWLHVKHNIPQGDQGLASSFEVTPDMLKTANLERLEHVTVTMNVEHTRRGDLSVELRSPTGMVSHIATHRRNDNANAGYVDWTFMSVAHWGESGIGKWTVIVKDTNVNEHNGTFTDWKLRLWGESIDGEKQGLIPMPGDHDDDDHDLQPPQQAPVHTTSIEVPTETGAPPGNPTDHIDRPTKPTETESPTTGDDKSEDEPEEDTTPSATSTSSFFLPHIFPTFGVSPRTQIWMYGAITLIIIFLAALGGWFYYMRRKRRWMNSRDDYGFEMVDREDEDEEQAPLAGAGGARKKGKRRAGELYDAFAEGSSEDSDVDEAEMFDVGSDGESEDEGTAAAGTRGGRLERYKDHGSRAEGLDVDP
jgi:kexin